MIERSPVDFDIPRRNHKLPVAYDEREQALLLAAAELGRVVVETFAESNPVQEADGALAGYGADGAEPG